MDDSGHNSDSKQEQELPDTWNPVLSQSFSSFSDDLAFLEEPGLEFPNVDENLETGFDQSLGVEDDSVGSPSTLDAGVALGADRSTELQVLEESSGSDGRRYNLDTALSVAFNTTVADQPKQVWETGIWKFIFGPPDSTMDFGVWGQPVTRPIPTSWGIEYAETETQVDEHGKRKHSHSCTFMDVVSFKPDVPWKDQRESDLQRSINLWVAVTSRWAAECSLRRQLDQLKDSDECFNMFAHVFSGRAPVTIRKRGMAIVKLCDHLEDRGAELFPMQELTFYRFLCAERMSGAPPTRLKGMLQAVTFCRHVLDMPELQGVLDSRRCRSSLR